MREETVGVVGLGYIGLAFVGACANIGFRVIGLDINERRVASLQEAHAPDIYEPGLSETFQRCRQHIEFTTDFAYLMQECGVVLVTVSTPVGDDNSPNMTHLEAAVASLGPFLRRDQVIILKSTVVPGTTAAMAVRLKERSGLEPGRDFYIGFCPERTIEGQALHELYTLPKIVGGINEASTARIAAFMTKLGGKVVRVSSPAVAELCKLIDNLYRATNIAFANEIGFLCEKMGLDAYEVAGAVGNAYERTRIFKPGLGADGPCLSKDPHMFAYLAKMNGIESPLTDASARTNAHATSRVAGIVGSFLQAHRLERAKVALIGLAFKGFPETDDVRGSPTVKIYEELGKLPAGLDYVWYDPIVTEFDGQPAAVSLDECVRYANVVLLLTNHPSLMRLDFRSLVGKAARPLLIVDCWHNVENIGALPEGVEIFRIGSGQL